MSAALIEALKGLIERRPFMPFSLLLPGEWQVSVRSSQSVRIGAEGELVYVAVRGKTYILPATQIVAVFVSGPLDSSD